MTPTLLHAALSAVGLVIMVTIAIQDDDSETPWTLHELATFTGLGTPLAVWVSSLFTGVMVMANLIIGPGAALLGAVSLLT